MPEYREHLSNHREVEGSRGSFADLDPDPRRLTVLLHLLVEERPLPAASARPEVERTPTRRIRLPEESPVGNQIVAGNSIFGIGAAHITYRVGSRARDTVRHRRCLHRSWVVPNTLTDEIRGGKRQGHHQHHDRHGRQLRGRGVSTGHMARIRFASDKNCRCGIHIRPRTFPYSQRPIPTRQVLL